MAASSPVTPRGARRGDVELPRPPHFPFRRVSPVLLDGGTVTAPRRALFGLNQPWEVENVGIAPAIEVNLEPKLVGQGRASRLEEPVEVVLDALKKNPLPDPPVPVYPKYPPH